MTELKEMESEIVTTGVMFGDAETGERLRDINQAIAEAFSDEFPDATVDSFEVWWTPDGYKYKIEATLR